MKNIIPRRKSAVITAFVFLIMALAPTAVAKQGRTSKSGGKKTPEEQVYRRQLNQTNLLNFTNVRGLERSGTNLMQMILDNCNLSPSCSCSNHLSDGETMLGVDNQRHTPCWKHFIPREPDPQVSTEKKSHGSGKHSREMSCEGSSGDKKKTKVQKIYSLMPIGNLTKLDDITGYSNSGKCGSGSSGSLADRPITVVIMKNVFHWVSSVCKYHKHCKLHNRKEIECYVRKWNAFSRQFLHFYQEAPERIMLCTYEGVIIRPQKTFSHLLQRLEDVGSSAKGCLLDELALFHKTGNLQSGVDLKVPRSTGHNALLSREYSITCAYTAQFKDWQIKSIESIVDWDAFAALGYVYQGNGCVKLVEASEDKLSN